MSSIVKLLLECYELTKNYDIPDAVQTAIEKDYLQNGHLYDDKLIKSIMAWSSLFQDSDPQFIIDLAKNGTLDIQ